jgi:hypothetical protein
VPICSLRPKQWRKRRSNRFMHCVLFYDVADDYVARCSEFRGAHLEKARAAVARGELVLAGAFANLRTARQPRQLVDLVRS